jgi:hypothetical protein
VSNWDNIIGVLVSGLVSGLCYTNIIKEEGTEMQKLDQLWLRYGTFNNLKVLYILLTLIALAVAGGAPCTGSGN